MMPRQATQGVTEDTVLGGRVRLCQPASGYRVAIDPVMLAAAVPAAPGDMILDVGAGVGTAALCLAWRVPNARVRGVEVQSDLFDLAQRNIEANGVGSRVEIMLGDLLRPPSRLAPGSFNHVMANPPYLPNEAGPVPPEPGEAMATREQGATLAEWIRFSITMLRPKGSVTVIYRADRMELLLAALAQHKIGEIVVFPLWPGGNRPASRILVRARKDVGSPSRLAAGLVLHESDGRYTAAAEAVLRDGAGLVL